MLSLLLLFVIPFASSIIAFTLYRANVKHLKNFTFFMSLIPLVILLYGHENWIGTQIQYSWIPSLSVEFYLKIDALSLVFLYLVAALIPISVLSISTKDLLFPNALFGLVLFLQGLLIIFFTARDLVVFTLFWEAMLIPLYLIISLWGGEQRQQASLKFIIYMVAGSLLMVAAVLSLYFTAASLSGTGTFNLDELAKITSGAQYAGILGAIFLLAFAVKTPLFPFHAWLPDAYCQAPLVGTILLSALLSKAGIYGILRIGMELFPGIMKEWNWLLLGFAIAGVFYGGLAAWMQNDFKRLIAYSSLSHVNFILAGLFIWDQIAHSGAILQAFNHGITIAALFLVAGWLEERINSTSMEKVGGLAKFMPQLCWITLFFVLSSVALPGLNSFIGEFLILFGLFEKSPWLAALLALTVILSVVYMLRWMQKVYFEAPHFFQESWIDIKSKEVAIAVPLIAIILWIGIYPAPMLKQIKPAVERINTFAIYEDGK